MKTYSSEFYLTASDVTPWEEMPLSRLVSLVIDTATGHANQLGVGFARLQKYNASWVLSRLCIDMPGAIRVNRSYRITTWVYSLNRLASERLFQIEDIEAGQTVTWVHSTWMAIDMDTRRPTDLTVLTPIMEVIDTERPFPGPKGDKLRPISEAEGFDQYTFKVTDIDVNRHVTTRRYIEMIVDIRDLDFYSTHRISRFEIAFKHEARYGQKACVRYAHAEGIPEAVDVTTCDPDSDSALPYNLARVYYIPR